MHVIPISRFIERRSC